MAQASWQVRLGDGVGNVAAGGGREHHQQRDGSSHRDGDGAWHAGACWQPLVDEARVSIARGEGIPAEDVRAQIDTYLKSIGAR